MRGTRIGMTGLAALTMIAALAAPVLGQESPAQAPATVAAAGPPLWRVSRGGNELWLFGTLSVVPQDLTWSSTAVERAIAGSQAVLQPPGARPAISLKPVQLVRAWRRVRELSRNPRGTELADVLPPDLNRRYAALRERYVGRARGFEELRPIVAAFRVYEAAVEDMDLASGGAVLGTVERLARRARIEPVDPQVHIDPEVLLDQVERVPLAAELDCVDKVFERVERGASEIDARARAWAAGDVAALRRFDYPNIRKDCLEHPDWPESLRAILRSADEQWLAAAERALATHKTSFSTLDLRDLIAPDGLLAQLRARGYEIREP